MQVHERTSLLPISDTVSSIRAPSAKTKLQMKLDTLLGVSPRNTDTRVQTYSTTASQ